MSPADAGEIEFEEPDWAAVFEDKCARKPDWPRYLQEVDAFEATLKHWRRHHATSVVVDGEDKRLPAPAVDGIIALAGLGIMAPRSEWRDLPRDGRTGYQSDDHCWLSISGEQWRITGIEDKMLHLEKMLFTTESPETRQIDLNRADWTAHTEAALKIIATMRA